MLINQEHSYLLMVIMRDFDYTMVHNADDDVITYTFSLTVTDIYGAYSTSELLVELLPENATPVVTLLVVQQRIWCTMERQVEMLW